MKERPIIFSAPMVRALLDGSKTQTRRIYKMRKHPDSGCAMTGAELARQLQPVIENVCPYGRPGDRLWVKETWSDAGTGSPDLIRYRADYPASVLAEFQRMPPPARHPWKSSLFMRRTASRALLVIVSVRMERLQSISKDDAIAEGITVCSELKGRGDRWHCPPHIRRIGEGDRVEDIVCEGGLVEDPREAYRGVWSAINGAGSWEANPWVWVLAFRKVE